VNSKSKNQKSTGPPSGSVISVRKKILACTRTVAFRDYVQKLLVELCRIDTTPRPDVAALRSAEVRCFQIIKRELASLPFVDARVESRAIQTAIQTHSNYSSLYFTKASERPQGLFPEKAYAGRSNLVYVMPGSGSKSGISVAINAHIDVVAPYFSPKIRGRTVYGRGACDDKGPLVSMLAALKVLSEVMPQAGWKWNRNIVAMFVVEEETGGNGSLSLAIDRELKRLYDSVLVGEPTSLQIHPANRGAVWYRVELKPPRDVSAFEMSAFVIEELEKEGAAIRAESRHALFPQRPVQTCHGIIGRFGEHPSRICGEVSFAIRFKKTPSQQLEALARDCLDSGLANHLGLYGDKTKVTDPVTKKPIVARHLDIRRNENGFNITVYGATGHMGAIRERDGAITKMAHLIRSLVRSKSKLCAAGGAVNFDLFGTSTSENLVLEGGQGFLPTHQIKEVMGRMRLAAQRGAENYLRYCHRDESGEKVVVVTFDKLHNAAFDGEPDSPTMRNAIAAAKTAGLGKTNEVSGWTVSCDARLFATEYPGMPVLTFGPGELAVAHSDQEQIALNDIQKAAGFLALFLLRQTGTLANI